MRNSGGMKGKATTVSVLGKIAAVAEAGGADAQVLTVRVLIGCPFLLFSVITLCVYSAIHV
jgi:hypothetical protein